MYVFFIDEASKQRSSPNGCGTTHITNSAFTETLFYAVDRINANKNILQNATIGVIIIDSCYSMDRVKGHIDHIYADPQNTVTGNGNNVAFLATIGPSSSFYTTQIAPYLAARGLTIVSVTATSPLLSNKERYPTFLRMAPSDVEQAKAIINFIVEHKWQYFGTLYSDSPYGTAGIKEIIQCAAIKRLKIAYQIRADDSYIHNEKAVDYIFKTFVVNNFDKVKILVAFLNPVHANAFIRAAKRFNLTGIMWIASDYWHNVDNDITGYEEYVHGAVVINFPSKPIPALNNYFESIDIHNYDRNPYLQRVTEETNHCFINMPNREEYPYPCPSNLTFNSSLIQGKSAQMYIDALTAVAEGVDSILKAYCPDERLCARAISNLNALPQRIREVTFTSIGGEKMWFDGKGDGPSRYEYLNYQVKNGNGKYIVVSNNYE